ncbi:MAG: sigma 54-interacting transcriptional regulator [Planctomycetota bacterium]
MTTALIGRAWAGSEPARVALVSRHAGSLLAPLRANGGHETLECPDWAAFATRAADTLFDLLLCDAELVGGLPRDVAAQVLVLGESNAPVAGDLPVIAVSALEHSLDSLLAMANALSRCNTRCRELERLIDGIRTGSAMVGQSPAMRRLATAVSRAADCNATVLVEGPPGSGKSLAARMVHCKSRRSSRPLASIDCETATAESMARCLAEAQGSSIVCEQIDRLPNAAQAVLVRHLKERSAATESAPRIIATTSAHLPELVARGAFREDLYYRLHTFPIVVPALRERSGDLALLAQSILEGTVEPGRPTTLTPAAMAMLENMTWPGNVAQLEAVLRRAQLAAGGNTIDREHLAVPVAPCAAPAARTPQGSRPVAESDEVTEESILPFEQEEQRMLTRALAATKGNVRRAAQLLGIGRATLYRKIQQYQLRLQ